MGIFCRTDFERETDADFYAPVKRVYTVDETSAIRHLQTPCLHLHRNGQWLVSVRVDLSGKSEQPDSEPSGRYAFGEMLRQSSEGDSTNEQALFFSTDQGHTWRMANGGKPILTLEHGTSFAEPSSISHSMIFEDEFGDTWMYYVINQPHTCGPEYPGRSTGGGEIRKIRIVWDGSDWRAAGSSEVVWGFMQPLDDGRGGTWSNVRTASLNPIIRTKAGTLLMPIMGRTTVADPRGDYWKFNRCWVLESRDGGRTWPNSFFIGGSNSLSLCEPAIAETSVPGEIVAYMRVQYGTGNQLYRSFSRDFGHTWSPPEPTGLPNTNGSGTKPFFMKLKNGKYALLQTNEHFTDDRSNMALFLTDEDGLRKNRWHLVKELLPECDSGWKGACYAWGVEGDDGKLHVAFTSYTDKFNHLNYAALEPEWLEGTVFEPVAPNDSRGNHLPRLTREQAASGEQSLKFVHVRGRAGSTKLGRVCRYPVRLEMGFLIWRRPAKDDFHLMHVSTNNGRDLAFTVSLRPSVNRHLWVYGNGGWIDTGVSPEDGKWSRLVCRIENETEFRLDMDGCRLRDGAVFRVLAEGMPDVWLIGANAEGTDDCEIYVDDVGYGSEMGAGQ